MTDRQMDMCNGCAGERDPYRIRKAPYGADELPVPDFNDETEG